LAGKVQKEVEVTVELDKHIFKNFESTSESSSLLNHLLTVSSTLSHDVKRVLFKILRDGFEVSKLTHFIAKNCTCEQNGTYHITQHILEFDAGR